jgi:hypothetical protein
MLVIVLILIYLLISPTHQNLGQMEIGSLEAKWEQKYDTNDDYMEDVEGKAVSNDNSGSTAVHMELFYDNAEESYGGPVFDASSRNNVGVAC